MFEQVTLHGGEAMMSWGWHTAAVFTRWQVQRTRKGQWALVADVARADPFKLEQRPLLFNAPRKGGYWCWPVKSVTLEPRRLTAALGPLEY